MKDGAPRKASSLQKNMSFSNLKFSKKNNFLCVFFLPGCVSETEHLRIFMFLFCWFFYYKMFHLPAC
jgi:hypothetical protein